jgi:hypothetical protein
VNIDIGTFGDRARKIKAASRTLCSDAHLARVYVKDTADHAGEADFDLLNAAYSLELAARDLRQLHARIEQQRADLHNPVLIAAE